MTIVVDVGLTTILCAVPSAVLAGAMGPYDEPKAWMLATLVGLTVLAWLAGRALGTPPAPPSKPERALQAIRWTLLAYGVWWGVATAFSVAPGQSLWGGFGRGFGLVSFLATCALFGIVQAEVRTQDRACRLIDLALIGSVPVVALALGQALGWDPLPPAWDPAIANLRVRSTFGQHIFLGSYLIALIPLGVGRVMATREQRDRLRGPEVAVALVWATGMIGLLGLTRHGALATSLILAWCTAGATMMRFVPSFPRVSVPPAWRSALLVSLVAAQTLALVLSTARGALVGLVAGLVTASAVYALGQRGRSNLVMLGLGVLLIVLFVGLLNLGVSPFDRLKTEVRLFGRLGSIAELREGSPGWVRVRLWEGILSRWPRQLVGEEILPGLPPALRILVGFGPETQILLLDRFVPTELKSRMARQGDWSARYTFDRAHNELLDHLIATGIIGMLVWLGLMGGVIAVGVMRLRSASGAAEVGIRLGCLATVVGQAVEGLVGIASPLPRGLFWMAAGILTLPSPLPSAAVPASIRGLSVARRPSHWSSVPLLAGLAVLLIIVVVGNTRWLLGSMAYATGIKHGIAGDLPGARQEFLRAVRLAPWIPFPAEAAADVSLRLTRIGGNLTPRADWLPAAQAALDLAHGYTPLRSDLWRLSGQIALARAGAGQPEQLGKALRDFSEAARLRPGDPEILAQWALALVQSGNPEGARRLAEEALTSDRRAWLAWAVLSMSYRQLGDVSSAYRCAEEARRLAPSTARDLTERLLR